MCNMCLLQMLNWPILFIDQILASSWQIKLKSPLCLQLQMLRVSVFYLILAGYPASLGFPISIMHPFHAICTGSTS